MIKKINELWLDLGMRIFKDTQIDSVVYFIIWQLYGYIHNDLRFNKEKIINQVMELQLLLIVGNELSNFKIIQLKKSFRILLFNELNNVNMKMDNKSYTKIYNIFKQVTNELSTTNYLNEYELNIILNTLVKNKKQNYTKIKRK